MRRLAERCAKMPLIQIIATLSLTRLFRQQRFPAARYFECTPAHCVNALSFDLLADTISPATPSLYLPFFTAPISLIVRYRLFETYNIIVFLAAARRKQGALCLYFRRHRQLSYSEEKRRQNCITPTRCRLMLRDRAKIIRL